jgi:DNA primase
MSAAKKLLSKLGSVKKTKSGWSARCPAHEDRQASLSIAEGDGGRVLLKCHAGCDHKKIVAALGLVERDLFDEAETRSPATQKSSTSKAATPASKAYKSADEAQKAYERRLGKPTRSWTYRDPETLDETGRVIRWDRPDGKKEIRPLSLHADGWRLEHMAEPRPLYAVEFFREDADRVYVVEGEKCCQAMSFEGGLGLASTTSSGGSNAASRTDWSPLAGREVVILPDADEAGRKYADEVAAILLDLDPPAVVRIVDLAPDTDDGSDVADFVREELSGVSDPETHEERMTFLRGVIEKQADETEPLKPKAATAGTTPAAEKAKSKSQPVEGYKPYLVDALPEPLSSFVTEAAAAIGCDPAYVALPLLTVAGAAIGTTRRLELKAGYTVPAILWTVVVGESGTSKSPALRLVLDHVRLYERRLREEARVARLDYEDAQEVYKKELAAWRATKDAGTDQPERPLEPRSRRALVTETTVEALAVKLADNARGLLLARDELAGFFNGLDRYASKSGGGSSDESFYLSAYNGEPHTVDRRTGDRREIYVPSAALWITGGIQPAILRRALGSERRESGLLARLLLTAPPARPAKWSEEEVSPITRQVLHGVLDRLYALQPEVDAEGHDEPRRLLLDPDAKKAYVAWHDQHGEELAELTGDKAAAWSKLRETAARLALIFHEVRVAGGEDVAANYVDAESMDRALRLVEWHKAETRRVYTILGQTDEEMAARQADDRLASWIDRHGGTTSARDVLSGCHRWLATSDEVESALRRLIDAGRGHWLDKPAGEKGGRPTRLFVLNQTLPAKESKNPPPASAQPRREAALLGCGSADAAEAEEAIEI